ncbi:Predicted arabinose efflux permease, MFS family [Ruegeria halocynthiae]|uniref:Predicted arabinose efflux permease, MFS family n=1 Tax=Ruegeria halocynthiae TaxID=985054 RepID=A0A1H2XZE9_9RHOB|nr:MFS transporter [Ruegeria halocynthiae]SDW97968.1 Predicted arabinose efflux permease, MFS family [Ruegeria halocynthiae]
MSSVDNPQRHTATIDEVITTVVMARVTDFFGFFVYAIASALVFPRLFFPMLDPLNGTLASFAIFSLAFLARPVASLAGRTLQYKIGRVGKVTLALLLLGTSTVAIGLLPGYEKIGWLAPVFLAVLRILQGLGLGGAWDGLTLQLQNAAPEHRKGLYAMVPQLGGPIGFVVAASIFFVLNGFLTDEEFLKWGWRFAFFAVMAVNVVSLYARVRLLNADLGVDPEVITSAPLPELVRNEGKTIFLSACLPLASYALFHMVTVFPLAFAAIYERFEITEVLTIQLIGGALAILTVIASGILADLYNRRTVIALSTLLIVILSLMIGTLAHYPYVFILFGFMILGLSYGQAGAVVPKRFPKRYRYSGSAMATNLSWIIGAAFAPLVGIGLTALLGLWAAGLYLLSGAIVTFGALHLLNRREATGHAD